MTSQLSKEQVKSIKKLLARSILSCVMTKGGGLYTVVMSRSTPKPSKKFDSFVDYQTWAIAEAESTYEKYKKTEEKDDEDSKENDKTNSKLIEKLVSKILPMYCSDKDDGGVMFEIEMEIKDIFDEEN